MITGVIKEESQRNPFQHFPSQNSILCFGLFVTLEFMGDMVVHVGSHDVSWLSFWFRLVGCEFMLSWVQCIYQVNWICYLFFLWCLDFYWKLHSCFCPCTGNASFQLKLLTRWLPKLKINMIKKINLWKWKVHTHRVETFPIFFYPNLNCSLPQWF